ncbi:hypothetical protein BV25DRAFT_1853471 [Artomyces pyxidatus]|uniref:Uncharacterized protein n=1 Tax=Artomyces pyxidatus TaxID=48021 RepID=A0ACB8T5X4_9AGAM|nr:hypothetical protein BV25DRAFT_1853471 [Artomyces pyxidatus]
MHPRNRYREAPDFSSLATDYPPLRPYIVRNGDGGNTIDFKDDAAQRRLTEALLHRDFDISLSIPNNRLCPPVGYYDALNYVLWIQDLVQMTTLEQRELVRGIDIGTGASAIYPLLACRLCATWNFVCTDIDELSIQYAKSNVERNGLADRICILKATPAESIFFPLNQNRDTAIDFTMCNPPFYSSAEDVTRSAEAKEVGPNAVCTGAEVEMITPGGESQFVCAMVRESVELQDRCRWYTSMLGKLSSLSEVVTLLRSHSIDNYAITELVQGMTRRWVIAWSFGDIRLPDALARISNPALHNLMPARTTLHQPLPHVPHPLVLSSVLSSMKGVIISSVPTQAGALLASAVANTWTRAARRKLGDVTVDSGTSPQLVCRVCVVQDDEGPIVEFVWVKGRDRSLFESFVNHVGRKIREVVK